MTNPPEWTEQRTETQRLADDLTDALQRIRKAWPEMLPAEAPGRRIKSSHGTPPGIVATHGFGDYVTSRGNVAWDADHSPREDDLDTLTRIASLRAFVTARLNSWCRLVMVDRNITNPASLPVGDDAMGMCAFLERHAEWLSGHEDAAYAREELTDDARACERWTDPYRKEWHALGECPFAVDDDEAVSRFCRGRVRVRIADDSDEATCSDCGKSGMVQWWEAVLGVTRERIIGPVEAAACLANHYGMEVNERTVRRWAGSGRISQHIPFGPQTETPRYWFDERTLLDDVARMDRECVLCGTIHSGGHQLCLRCLSTTWRNTPKYADDPQPVTSARTLTKRRELRATREGITRLVEQLDQWCTFGDLPSAWCACGRHAS